MTCERKEEPKAHRKGGGKTWKSSREGTRVFFFLCVYPVGLLNTVRILKAIQTTSKGQDRPKWISHSIQKTRLATVHSMHGRLLRHREEPREAVRIAIRTAICAMHCLIKAVSNTCWAIPRSQCCALF